jgi:hypothetical protein
LRYYADHLKYISPRYYRTFFSQSSSIVLTNNIVLPVHSEINFTAGAGATLSVGNLQQITCDNLGIKGAPFILVSSNYAHNLTFFLSRAAFRKFGVPKRPKVILNFDDHQDYGGVAAANDMPSGGEVGNGAWGQWHVCHQSGSDLKDVCYTYAVFGCVSNPPPRILHRMGNEPLKNKPIEGKKGKTDENVLADLHALHGNDDCDVWVTIDCDVLSNSLTDFGTGGKWDAHECIAWVWKALRCLGGYKLVGMDVVGLPSRGSRQMMIEDIKDNRLVYGKRLYKKIGRGNLVAPRTEWIISQIDSFYNLFKHLSKY